MAESATKPLYDEPAGGFKRRRLQNACDLCKQKKIRCDSAKMPGGICSNCIAFNSECTHRTGVRNKAALRPEDVGPDFARIQISAILSSSTPYVLPDDPETTRKVLTEIAAYARSLEKELAAARRSTSPPSSDTTSSPRPVYSSAFTESKGQDYLDVEISDPLGRLNLSSKHSFFGKSSQMALLKTAIDTKHEYSSILIEGRGPKRLAFWNIYPWQKVDTPPLPPLEFPEPDLFVSLIDLYFTRYNSFLPLLHRPTFEKNIKESLHLQERYFGELVLAVCAIGARFSRDSRVYFGDSQSEQSVGWKYFRQIHPFRPSFSPQPSIYEVQLICTSCMFLQSTSTPDLCWSLLALGVRYAQAVGAHRRWFNGKKASVQGELWKRAFWALVGIDVYMSAFLGRSRAAHPADYDLDLPIACDDEFWEHPDPEKAFRQPPGKPSYVEAWVSHLKLLSILGFAQHHMFAVKRVEQWANITDDKWEEKVVIELDSALNQWIDEVPHHLRWNPHRENQLFFEQSSSIYCAYYWIQIQIHRPFITVEGSENKTSGMSYSSLAVCANAARSCSHVLDINTRKGYVPFPSTMIALFNSAIVLLLNLWRGRRAGLSVDPVREMDDVYKCVNTLHMYENRWEVAGRLSDIISELISFSDAPLESHTATRTAYPESQKRRRVDADISTGTGQETTTSSSAPLQQAPQFTGVSGSTISTGSTQQANQSSSSSSPSPAITPETSHLFGLPLHTEDLGRLPIHFPENSGEQVLQPAPILNPPVPEYSSSKDAWLYQQNPSSSSVYGDPNVQESHDVPGPEVLNYEPYVVGMWATPGGDRWEDWDSYMSTVDDLLRAASSSSQG